MSGWPMPTRSATTSDLFRVSAAENDWLSEKVQPDRTRVPGRCMTQVLRGPLLSLSFRPAFVFPSMPYQDSPPQGILVQPALPPALRRLSELAYNLLWVWDGNLRGMFRRLDPTAWRNSGR
jgi:hypothetical protein